MNAQPRFGRLITAMVTPFDESGALLLDSAGKLAAELVEGGNEALVINGTTGESPTLDRAERIALFHEILCATDRKTPIIANVGDNCTHDSVAFARKVESLGVHAIMAVTPYYNKPPQEGLYRHFRSIAAAVDVPMIVYNIPGRCVTNIEPETILRLAHDVDNIVAVKQANSDLSQVETIVEGAPEGFEVLSGDDGMTIPMMEKGGTGVISVLGNLLPTPMRHMIDSYAAGDIAEATRYEEVLMPLASALFDTTSPILIKKALELGGFEGGGLRLPLIEATKEQTAKLKEVMDMTYAQLETLNAT
ncbi:MAG: 4-hydroxy-tetrahydrodipicolinate synthase [Coriobacteriia bacterium]|nr:4-hydroxy-tetrahydrodipicolinate synthase [Coriobacteriia bacterium]